MPEPEHYLRTDHVTANLGARTARGGVIVAATRVLQVAVQTATTMVLARLLVPGDFGLVGMVAAFTRFILLFKDLGLSTATIQRAELTQPQVSSLFWINVFVGVVLSAIALALAPLVAWFYEAPALTGIAMAISTSFLITAIGVQHQALLKRQMRFGTLAAIELSAAVVSSLVAIAMALSGSGYWALVVQLICAAGVISLGSWIGCGWRPAAVLRAPGVGELVSFGGHVTGFNFVTFLARNLDDIIVGRFFGAAALGLYQKAYDLMMLPVHQVNRPFSAIAVPALSRLTDDAARYRTAFGRILELILLMTMPLGALLIATADWTILVVLGEQWTAAAELFAAFSVAVMTQPIGMACSWLFLSQGRTAQMLRVGSASAVVTTLSFFIGLPWGPFGIATAYAVGHLLRLPFVVHFASAEGPVRTRDVLRGTALPALAAASILGCVLGMRTALSPSAPVLGLALAAAVALPAGLLPLLMLPAGRAGLRDLLRLRKVFQDMRTDG